MFAIGDLPIPSTTNPSNFNRQNSTQNFYDNSNMNNDFLKNYKSQFSLEGSHSSLASATTFTGGDSAGSDVHPTIVATGKTGIFKNISPFRPDSINLTQRELSNGLPSQLSPDDISPNNFTHVSQPLHSQLAFLQNLLSQIQYILPHLQAQIPQTRKMSQFNNFNQQQLQEHNNDIRNFQQHKSALLNHRSFLQSNHDEPFFNTLISQFDDNFKNSGNNSFSQMLLNNINNGYNPNGSCSPLINNLPNALLSCTTSNLEFDVCCVCFIFLLFYTLIFFIH